MRRARLLSLVAWTTAAVAAAAAGAPSWAQTDPLVDAVNRERMGRGGVPLIRSPALFAYAQDRAEAIARSGKLRSADSSEERGERMRAVGYEPYLVSEVMAEVAGDADEVVRDWRRAGPDTFDELLRSEFRDVGVGRAVIDRGERGERGKRRERQVFVLVVGLSWQDLFTERTAPLHDLVTVRAEMIRRVNEERRERRRTPLRLDTRLNRAAQEYAERMLREAFYAHTAPGGDTVLDRSRAVSYPVSTVAENLALGPWSVEEAVEGWMESPGHRENLLELKYRDLGVGLAFGRNQNGWQVIWVQVFGLPR